jgi:hypothetical protein
VVRAFIELNGIYFSFYGPDCSFKILVFHVSAIIGWVDMWWVQACLGNGVLLFRNVLFYDVMEKLGRLLSSCA